MDITTRANIQLRGMPFEDSVDVVRGLQERGLTSLMSGLDNLRNMVGSPIAGKLPVTMIQIPPGTYTIVLLLLKAWTSMSCMILES